MLDAGLSSTRVHVALRCGARRRATTSRACASSPTGATCGRATTTAQILDALRAGQLALFVAVDQVAADVDADVRAFDAERAAFVERLKDSGT